jgi:hypothetical protein
MATLLVLDGRTAVSIRKLPARTRTGFSRFHCREAIQMAAMRAVENGLALQGTIIFLDDAT